MKNATVVRLRDPILGWRWVIDCPWHGVVGRWRTKREALLALSKHEAKDYPTRDDDLDGDDEFDLKEANHPGSLT